MKMTEIEAVAVLCTVLSCTVVSPYEIVEGQLL